MYHVNQKASKSLRNIEGKVRVSVANISPGAEGAPWPGPGLSPPPITGQRTWKEASGGRRVSLDLEDGQAWSLWLTRPSMDQTFLGLSGRWVGGVTPSYGCGN